MVELVRYSVTSGGFRGGRGGANEPPFEADNSDFAVKVF